MFYVIVAQLLTTGVTVFPKLIKNLAAVFLYASARAYLTSFLEFLVVSAQS